MLADVSSIKATLFCSSNSCSVTSEGFHNKTINPAITSHCKQAIENVLARLKERLDTSNHPKTKMRVPNRPAKSHSRGQSVSNIRSASSHVTNGYLNNSSNIADKYRGR